MKYVTCHYNKNYNNVNDDGCLLQVNIWVLSVIKFFTCSKD